MNNKVLLVRKYGSLKAKNLDDHMDLLEAANIIYLMFLDSNCLFDQVNRDIRFQLEFKFPKFNASIIIDGEIIDPIACSGGLRGNELQTFKKDAFFKATEFRYGDKNKSVQDLVKFYRNAKGGSHFSPKSEEHKNLKAFSELVYFNNQQLEAYDDSMKIIVQSVIDALELFINNLEKKA